MRGVIRYTGAYGIYVGFIYIYPIFIYPTFHNSFEKKTIPGLLK